MEEKVNISDEEAQDALIYGLNCFQIIDNNYYNSVICLSPITSNEIYFINQTKTKIIKTYLYTIANISFNSLQDIQENCNPSFYNTYFCQILINRESYDFYFTNKTSFLLFIKGILTISKINSSNYNTNVNICTNKFNEYISDEINDDELKYFANCLGINFADLKAEVDINKDNKITSDEIKSYIKQRLSGEQYKNIFDKYSTANNEYKEKVMGPIDLQNFFIEFQREEISYLESCQIIIQFNSLNEPERKRKVIQSLEDIIVKNKGIKKQEIKSILEEQNKGLDLKNPLSHLRIYLTLYEFNMMLNSLLLLVYDKKKLEKELDLDRPITDYYIKSTHNTYCTSHQLAGKSSTKMYSTSLLYNFRLVELDCYNGEGDNIIITHGFTLVSDLNLDDVLFELKDTAFINSDLPVILSIENHLDESHQIILANKFYNILGDLFIIPIDKKPEYIPTLRDMCNKFLIKLGGKKLWENENIPRKPYNSLNINQLEHHPNYTNHLKEDFPHLKLIEKKIIILDKEDDFIMPIKRKRTSVSINRRNSYNRQNSNIIYNAIKLEDIRGIFSTKLKNDKIYSNYYQPWEMISKKCSKAVKDCDDQNKRRDMVHLTQQCLVKIYPENFDSSNYNVSKCFACGIQSCALNIQATEDDYILYDKIFFKQNQGLGYVLKFDKFFSRNYNESYNKPKYICHMEIISLINCSILIENAKLKVENNGELTMKIYSIGVKEDENNPIFNYKLINGTMFPTFENGYPIIDYQVYDYELSVIMIKIKYNDKMIGRSCIPYNLMKQGLRRIPIYDNYCFSIDHSYMVGYFKLEKI